MTPRRRANALQAHSLHCQGLTYRQIAQRMQRSASTIAGYIKDFHAHRDEIAETLAADQLVHSLAGHQQPRPRPAPATHPSRPRTPPPGRHPRPPHRPPPTPRPPSLRRTERRLDPQPRSLRRTRRNPDQERPLGRPHPARPLLPDRPLPQRTKPTTSCRQLQELPLRGSCRAAACPALDAGTEGARPSAPRSDPKQPRKTLDQTHQNHPLPRSNPIKSEQTRSRSPTKSQQNRPNPEPNAENQRKTAANGPITRPNCPSEPNLRPIDPGRRPRLR